MTTNTEEITLPNQAATPPPTQTELRQAIASYDASLANNPRDTALLRSKEQALLSLGDFDGAIECLERIIALSPADIEARIAKGDLLANLKRDIQAIEAYDDALRLDPKNTAMQAAIWRSKAAVWKRAQQTEEADRAYEAALSIDPRDALSLRGKADLLLDTGDIDRASNLFEAAATIDPHSMNEVQWTLRADRLVRAGKLMEATKYYERAIKANEGYVWGWRGAALAFKAQGNRPKALEYFLRALAIAPDNPSIRIDIGDYYLEQGDYKAAEGYYSKATELEPENFFAWANKGVSLQNQGRFDAAVATYDKALSLHSDNSDVWAYKGYCLDQLGRLSDALDCYDKAIEFDARSFPALNNKGWALVRLGRREEGLNLLRQAIDVNPQDVHAWINTAHTLRQMGRLDDAEQCLRSGIDVVTDKSQILVFLGAILSEYKHDNDEALNVFEQALAWNSDSIEAQISVAEVLVRMGRYSAAREHAAHAEAATSEWVPRCIARFLILVSFGLEEDWPRYRSAFDNFIELFRDNSENKTVKGAWVYDGLKTVIVEKGTSTGIKFMLLTLIDLQMSDIALANLSFFKQPSSESRLTGAAT